MAAALVNICVDPRLNHEAIRAQVRGRAGPSVPARGVFITNEPGGNYGTAARGTIALLRMARENLTFAALLHHDDCAAAANGMRHSLGTAAEALSEELRQSGFNVPVLTGSILTEDSTILWSDRPATGDEVVTSRMPRMHDS